MGINTNQQLLEIDFRELIYKLLSQWKAILIASVVMALLICGMKHVQDVNAYKAAQEAAKIAEQQASIPLEERIAGVLEALPDEDREAVSFLVQEKRWLNEQKNYFNQSILMKTDPSNQRVLKMVYEITGEEEADMQGLLHNYVMFLYSEEICDAVKPYIAPGADNKYISELFYEDKDDNSSENITDNKAIFEINLVLPEEADADEITAALDKVIKTYCSETQSEHHHSIKKVSADDVHLYHKANVDNRNSMFSNVNGMQNNLRNFETYLTESQNAAWTAINAMLTKAETAEETVEAGAEAAEEVAASPGFSKKYALFGFVLGVFLYAFIYVVILILGGVSVSAASLKNISGSRLFGEAYYDNKATGLKKLFHSRLVNKIYHRNTEECNRNIEKMKASIDAACRHKNIEQLSYIDLTGEESKISAPDVFAAVAKGSPEKTSSIEINADDQFSEDTLLQINNAVLVAGNKTKAATLSKIFSLCRDYDIDLLGSMYIAEV